MVKYGKGVLMTKKMTITLEEEILNTLDNFSKKNGKKKAQIVREALTAYFNISSQEEKQKKWELENKDAIEKYNKMVQKDGIILKNNRMF